MPESPAFLKSGWLKLAGTLVLALLTFWIGKSGQQAPETIIVNKTDTLSIPAKVVHDTSWVAKRVIRAETLTVKDTVRITQFVYATRKGVVSFDDSSTYLRLHAESHYQPDSDSILFSPFRLTRNWSLPPPKVIRTNFSLGGHIKFFRAPDLELAMRWKETNHWFSLTTQPSFTKDGTFKTVFGAGWRWEF